MTRPLAAAAILVAVLVATPLAGQSSAAKPCTDDAYRQFDFWIGEWDVVSATGGSSGATNSIHSLHGGCVLREEYASGPFSGTSLSFYDKKAERWHQTWIDNQGQPLWLSGGIEDGKMVMRSPGETLPRQRITWTPLEEGRVRQLWETSKDGETWATVFDGTYHPKGGGGSGGAAKPDTKSQEPATQEPAEPDPAEKDQG